MPRVSRISLDLLQTFLLVLDRDGDAMAAARELEINQPSMSKRLEVLQHAGRGLRRPWLERVGKTWNITAEGQRVLPAVRDICTRYERLTLFLDPAERQAAFSFACGQQAAVDFVLRAVRRYRQEQPTHTFRIAQLRGAARIEGVANGSLDLAAVTHDPDQITAVARRDLHVDALPPDPLVLVARKADDKKDDAPPWSKAFAKLPAKGATAETLRSFPLILPEPDADVRRQIDQVGRNAGVLGEWNVVLEIGGWQAILAYARAGLGVGVVTHSAFERQPTDLVSHPLDPRLFTPTRVRLICRRRSTLADDLDLSPAAARFRELLLEEAVNTKKHT